MPQAHNFDIGDVVAYGHHPIVNKQIAHGPPTFFLTTIVDEVEGGWSVSDLYSCDDTWLDGEDEYFDSVNTHIFNHWTATQHREEFPEYYV